MAKCVAFERTEKMLIRSLLLLQLAQSVESLICCDSMDSAYDPGYNCKTAIGCADDPEPYCMIEHNMNSYFKQCIPKQKWLSPDFCNGL